MELSPAERDAYLETHCQDLAVRKEVDELLAHAGGNEQTLTGAFSAELGSCLDGDGSQLKSVLEVLAGELGAISQISLRDARGDESPSPSRSDRTNASCPNASAVTRSPARSRVAVWARSGRRVTSSLDVTSP